MLDPKDIEIDAPKKREAAPEVSSPNKIALKFDPNGKVNISLQTGMLVTLIALAFRVWTTFGQMHEDVDEAKESLGELVTSVQKLESAVSEAAQSAKENAEDIEAVKAEKQRDVDALNEKHKIMELASDTRFKAIELCIRKPKGCEL
jgi:hypothetical protein